MPPASGEVARPQPLAHRAAPARPPRSPFSPQALPPPRRDRGRRRLLPAPSRRCAPLPAPQLDPAGSGSGSAQPRRRRKSQRWPRSAACRRGHGLGAALPAAVPVRREAAAASPGAGCKPAVGRRAGSAVGGSAGPNPPRGAGVDLVGVRPAAERRGGDGVNVVVNVFQHTFPPPRGSAHPGAPGLAPPARPPLARVAQKVSPSLNLTHFQKVNALCRSMHFVLVALLVSGKFTRWKRPGRLCAADTA